MKCSQMVKKKIFDPKAETLQEIATAVGIGDTTARKLIKTNVMAGVWEKVWRRGEKFPIPAYRPAKRKVS